MCWLELQVETTLVAEAERLAAIAPLPSTQQEVLNAARRVMLDAHAQTIVKQEGQGMHAMLTKLFTDRQAELSATDAPGTVSSSMSIDKVVVGVGMWVLHS